MNLHVVSESGTFYLAYWSHGVEVWSRIGAAEARSWRAILGRV